MSYLETLKTINNLAAFNRWCGIEVGNVPRSGVSY